MTQFLLALVAYLGHKRECTFQKKWRVKRATIEEQDCNCGFYELKQAVQALKENQE